MSTPSVSTGSFLYYGKSGDASMCQILPGAMLMNTNAPDNGGSTPIFFSMKNLGDNFGMNDQDDYYLVMPGYELIIYQADNYLSGSTIFDNTNGVYMERYSGTGQTSSLKIYYQYTEITHPTLS